MKHFERGKKGGLTEAEIAPPDFTRPTAKMGSAVAADVVSSPDDTATTDPQTPLAVYKYKAISCPEAEAEQYLNWYGLEGYRVVNSTITPGGKYAIFSAIMELTIEPPSLNVIHSLGDDEAEEVGEK